MSKIGNTNQFSRRVRKARNRKLQPNKSHAHNRAGHHTPGHRGRVHKEPQHRPLPHGSRNRLQPNQQHLPMSAAGSSKPAASVVVHKAPLTSDQIVQLAKQSLAGGSAMTSSKRPQADPPEAAPSKVSRNSTSPQPTIKIRNDLFKEQRYPFKKNLSLTRQVEKELRTHKRWDDEDDSPQDPAPSNRTSRVQPPKASSSKGVEESDKKKSRILEQENKVKSTPTAKKSDCPNDTTKVTSTPSPRADRDASPELEIISESLVTRRPVLVYGGPVAPSQSTPAPASHSSPKVPTAANKGSSKFKNPLVNLSSTSNLPVVVAPAEKVPAPTPLGYSWPIKTKSPQVTNTNIRTLGLAQADEEEPAVPQEEDKLTSPKKITNYFSPVKSSPTKKSSVNGETSPEKPKAVKSPKSGKKLELQDKERKSTFLNLTAFKKILISVMNNPKFNHLINAEDHMAILSFIKISEEAKALLVHLSSVKIQWRRVTGMKYPELNLNIEEALQPLIEEKFVIREDELTDLREMLELLTVKEVKDLGKVFKLAPTKKSQTIDELIKLGQRQSSLQGSLTVKITKDVKRILGSCIKVNLKTTDVLHRMCLLDTLANCFDDSSLSDILFRANKVHFNQIVYPNYTIHMETDIFKERDHLIKFQEAYQLYKEQEKELLLKNWESVALSAKEAWSQFKEILADDKFKAMRLHDAKLPDYLQKFSAGNILARAMTTGLESLGRRKEYDASVHMLNDLLGQTIYCKRHRGVWYDRLALILHKNLKILSDAAEAVCQGIDDKHVHLSHKISLASRAAVLQKSKMLVLDKESKEKLIIYSQGQDLAEAQHISIQGRVKSHSGIPGQKMLFIIEGNNPDEISIGSVEECAIAHYKRMEGFDEGRHREGGTIVALFALLFWDEIYMAVPDAFISSHQSYPLDLYGLDFYKQRQKVLDAKLSLFQEWSVDQSLAHFIEKWEESTDKDSIIPQGTFRDAREAHSLYLCMGAEKVTKICLKLLKDFRNSRAGFPDLVVWSPGVENKYKFVEVKSPNDTLSDKQRVWIDFLVRIDVPVEVCHVSTVGENYLSRVNAQTPCAADSGPGPSA